MCVCVSLTQVTLRMFDPETRTYYYTLVPPSAVVSATDYPDMTVDLGIVGDGP